MSRGNNGGKREGAGRPRGRKNDRTMSVTDLYAKILASYAREDRRRQLRAGQKPDPVPTNDVEAATMLVAKLLLKASLEDVRGAIHLDERLHGAVRSQVTSIPPPPLLVLVGHGANGGQAIALGYQPQGIVPGMEALMPAGVEVEVTNAKPHGNGRRTR